MPDPIPVVVLGRLAVDREFHGQGLDGSGNASVAKLATANYKSRLLALYFSGILADYTVANDQSDGYAT